MKQLLLLHGALGSSAQFEGFSELFSSEYEVHALSFSGHGGVPFADSFSIDQFAKETQDYLLKHQLHNCHVFGYSMGGYVALYLENLHPGTFQSIFTLATKFNWTTESAEKEVKMLNPEVLMQKVPDFAQELANRHGEENWKELMHQTAQMMLHMGSNPPLQAQDLASIHGKTCIAVGSLDKMVSVEESQQAAQHLPNATFHLFEAWPHPFERTDWNALAETIHSFGES